MPDLYQQLVNSPIGKQIAKQVGLPQPVELRRYEPGDPILPAPAYVGGAEDGRLLDPTLKLLHGVDAEVRTDAVTPESAGNVEFGALVYDASGIKSSSDLRHVYSFFHDSIRHLGASGRLLILATPPAEADDSRHATAQRALEGFMRSAAKEMRAGATANLIQVSPDAEDALESTLRFFLSGRSAFVSGQVVHVGQTGEEGLNLPTNWDRPLDGQVAVVTGAAQGIGESIAEILARDGAHVVCLDLPAQGDQLSQVANRIGGTTFQVDITAEDAPQRIAEQLRERHDGVDVFVHNAGVTRDKTLAGMSAEQWDMVLEVNLSAQERVNDALLNEDVLNAGGRIISVSSISGIAGNRGQANYAASKAGIIGMVNALAETLANNQGTINGVAPGFIETEMTGEMPLVVREVGRRMNSLNQGGLPRDVGETIAWLANPASGGVNGQIVRVCGQSLLGA